MLIKAIKAKPGCPEPSLEHPGKHQGLEVLGSSLLPDSASTGLRSAALCSAYLSYIRLCQYQLQPVRQLGTLLGGSVSLLLRLQARWSNVGNFLQDLTRKIHARPNRTDCRFLCLFICCPTVAGWKEWCTQSSLLPSKQMLLFLITPLRVFDISITN